MTVYEAFIEQDLLDLQNKVEEKDRRIAELEKLVKDLGWQLQEVARDNDIYQAENKRLEKENVELEAKLENIRRYLDNEIPHELINEATTIIYKMV